MSAPLRDIGHESQILWLHLPRILWRGVGFPPPHTSSLGKAGSCWIHISEQISKTLTCLGVKSLVQTENFRNTEEKKEKRGIAIKARMDCIFRGHALVTTRKFMEWCKWQDLQMHLKNKQGEMFSKNISSARRKGWGSQQEWISQGGQGLVQRQKPPQWPEPQWPGQGSVPAEKPPKPVVPTVPAAPCQPHGWGRTGGQRNSMETKPHLPVLEDRQVCSDKHINTHTLHRFQDVHANTSFFPRISTIWAL